MGSTTQTAKVPPIAAGAGLISGRTFSIKADLDDRLGGRRSDLPGRVQRHLTLFADQVKFPPLRLSQLHKPLINMWQKQRLM